MRYRLRISTDRNFVRTTPPRDQGSPTDVVVVVDRCLSTVAGTAALVVVVVEEVSDGPATSGTVPLSLLYEAKKQPLNIRQTPALTMVKASLPRWV
jgi:hypothetical protein